MRPTKAAASQSRSAFRRRVPPRTAETARLAFPTFAGASFPTAPPWFPSATRLSFRLAGFCPRSGTESRRWCRGTKIARTQLPTCLHESAHAVPLDLPRLAGFSPERSEPHAAHRLLQSGRPTSTPNELPNPAGKCLRSDLSTGSSSLGREEPADLARTRGRPVLMRRFDPRATTARRTDLPQLVSVSRTPSCRDADASGDWNGSPAATCGCGNVRNSPAVDIGYLRLGRIRSPWHARPRPGHDLVGRGLPLGPLALPATRIAKRSAAPRVPSTALPRGRPARGGSSGSRGGDSAGRVSPIPAEPVHATPFSPGRPRS